jgi:murein DD-endopeptidase MepM/ murein hydrolase activator NlpD
MAQLDPRRQPVRLTPMIFVSAAALTVGFLIWRVFQPLPSTLPEMDHSAILALETRALAEAAARPGFAQPVNVQIMVRAGESLAQALTRSGVSTTEAQTAVNLLSQAFDVVNMGKGMSLQAAIAKPESGSLKPSQLLGLTVRTGPAKQLTLTTSHDGAMRLRALEESVREESRVAIGTIDGSLITSASALGATPNITGQVLKLFAHKIDFERDIKPGDTFKLVFDRKVTESGRVVESGNLLYAEITANGAVNRFYAFKRKGDKEPQYFDELGKNIKGFLLATPVAARTSSGFGMRIHPIQGFMKMHTGIDFAAPTGTPIYAAGDGIVADSKWWGGYGRWVRITHNADWQTGYAHMSRIAVTPGQRVKQGDLIGYVGSTGNSTGPHLHFEVWYKNRPINPKDAKVPQGTVLAGTDLVNFNAKKHEIDSMILMAEDKRTKDNQDSQTLAMKTSPYQYESTGTSNKLVATSRLDKSEYTKMRPALSSTRGSQ